MYDFSLDEREQLDTIAAFCAERGLSLTIHCEDPVEKEKIVKAGKYGTFDDTTEPDFVRDTVLPICDRYKNLKFIVAHVSHADTVELLKEAWDAGKTNLYAEITPHHLLLATEEIKQKLADDAVFGFCHPFVKISERHRDSLQKLALDGKYQDQILYGSDHAPHPEEAKRKEFGGVPNHQ